MSIILAMHFVKLKAMIYKLPQLVFEILKNCQRDMIRVSYAKIKLLGSRPLVQDIAPLTHFRRQYSNELKQRP